MTRSILVGAALAGAALVTAMPVTAQQSDGIVVSAPASRVTGEPKNGVQQRLRIATSMIVYTGDLDLRTSYGRDVLDRRVKVAADAACDKLDVLDPPMVAVGGDVGDCRYLAAKNAMPLVRRAILASG